MVTNAVIAMHGAWGWPGTCQANSKRLDLQLTIATPTAVAALLCCLLFCLSTSVALGGEVFKSCSRNVSSS